MCFFNEFAIFSVILSFWKIQPQPIFVLMREEGSYPRIYAIRFGPSGSECHRAQFWHFNTFSQAFSESLAKLGQPVHMPSIAGASKLLHVVCDPSCLQTSQKIILRDRPNIIW
ncbi:hypothetical protein XENOCAPTIV_021946 [Xenoophorus captivus]|uniref:Uncharacterized protein n=1 Tax=Xenoophorus captivus TaxID=1517983 RepID=A0ABV0R1Q0_9TELE